MMFSVSIIYTVYRWGWAVLLPDARLSSRETLFDCAVLSVRSLRSCSSNSTSALLDQSSINDSGEALLCRLSMSLDIMVTEMLSETVEQKVKTRFCERAHLLANVDRMPASVGCDKATVSRRLSHTAMYVGRTDRICNVSCQPIPIGGKNKHLRRMSEHWRIAQQS